MDLFGNKQRILQNKIDSLQSELYATQYQLSQWRNLWSNLKKFNWFEMNKDGGIIAHENSEPEQPHITYGTAFTVPHMFAKLRWDE